MELQLPTVSFYLLGSLIGVKNAIYMHDSYGNGPLCSPGFRAT